MNNAPHRTILYFLAACLLAWSLFSPNGALAANNTVTSGLFTSIYGNDGTATAPTTDTNTSNNTLTLGNGSSGPAISDASAMTIAGGQTASGTASGSAGGNALTINSGTLLGGSGTISLFGGRVLTGSGTADGNTITINGFTQSNNSVVVYGGRSSGSGNVFNNNVSINAGSTNNFSIIYGGYADSGDITGNSVNIIGGGQIQAIIGGATTSGNAGGSGAGNSVSISGGSANISNGIIGGSSDSGFASYNTVSIASGYTGTVGDDIAGGWINGGNGNAEYNSVEINGGIINSGIAIMGGHSTGGAATGNSVTIGGGTLGGDIYGGQTSDGSATGNSVTITTTGKTYQNIYGGHTNWSTSGDLFTGNTLNLNAGNTVSSVRNTAILNFTSGGNAGIGILDTTATGAGGSPQVTINTNANAVTFGGVINGTGGIDKTGAGTLTLSATNTYSGATSVTAGTLAGNIAANTDLTVAGGATYDGTGAAKTVKALNGAGSIINGSGLSAQSGAFSGVISGAGALNKTGGGTLTLSGANTYAGMTEVRAGTLALAGSGTLGAGGLALYDNTTFNAGSYATALPLLDVHGNATYTGNLNAANASLNFYVPATMSNRGVMLNVTGAADISGSTVNVGIESASSPLKVGDRVVLIDTGTLSGAPANSTASGQGMQGVTLKYEFDIAALGNQLMAAVSKGGVNEQAKALSEGFLSGAALLNMGSDLIAGPGLASARAAASGMGGLAGFGALSGGSLRHNTGSHVNVSGLSLLAGLALGQNLSPGRLTIGGFFEYGNGSYDTYNSFSNAADVHGNGRVYHLGGGILSRLDFSNTGPGNFYAEASGRAGGLHNDYDNADMRDFSGRMASFTSSSAYYGLHLGTGYLWSFSEKASLDMYAKYFWSHQGGDKVGLSTGESVDFNSANSHRLRLGGRFNYALNEYVSPYAGAAYEHEFDGTAKAATNGLDIEAPDLKGGSGMGELGLSVRPLAGGAFSLDLGVQGYAGQRQGVTGSLQMKMEF